MLTLDFLSSSFDPTGLDVDQIRDHIVHSPPQPIAEFLDADLLESFLEAYSTHLFKLRSRFGAPQSEEKEIQHYKTQFDAYVADTKSHASSWVHNLRLVSESPEGVINALQHFNARLSLVLDHGLFNSTRFGLEFPQTLAPLPNVFFMEDVGSGLGSVHHILEEALSWIDPFYGCSFAARANLTSYGLLKARMKQIAPGLEPGVLMHKVRSATSGGSSVP